MVRQTKSKKLLKKLFSPEEPQEGLVPLAGPFYATPSEPADPMDCDRYPDSPWCGGNPIDKTPLAIGIDIVQDECNFGVQFSGTFLFFKIPPVQIVYRNPACFPQPEEPEQNNDYEKPLEIPDGLNIYFLYSSYAYVSETLYLGNGRVGRYESEIIQNIAGVEFPYQGDVRISASYNPKVKIRPLWKLDLIVSNFAQYNGAWRSTRIGNTMADGEIKTFSHSTTFTFYGDGDQTGHAASYNDNGANYVYSFSYYQTREKLDNFLKYMRSTGYEVKASRKTTTNSISGSTRTEEKIPAIYGAPAPPPHIDPPPPPKKECCKMGCCPDNSNLERLLKLVLKKIGSDDLPASVPRILTKKDAGIIKISNLAQFISYAVKQLDAVSGKYPLEIKIKDADLTQEGDQEKKITVPNIGEALTEIMGMLLVLQSESNANLIATVNSMVEAGSAKQAAILASDYSRGNSEYLGYKGKQVERKVPFTFKPGESQMDKMLVGGEVKVKGWENDDKEDLNDALAPLLELAAMWKAANFKNLGTNDTLTKLKGILTGAVDLTSAVDKLVNTPPAPDPNNPDAPQPEAKKSDWDVFVEEAEQGFIAQPGITDTTNPYARPLTQRPKIREIGNDTSDGTGSTQ
ncbi:hypothetical protein [Nostoc sp. WHI]|uniref:hypothetical protein n=1 Tax=Nostoc sp. WHI TaxID=2650611 RepID=UPI0018C81876|nr:hypothetical protein [Nostoc sp. WHI]MBG1267743.1 hypothetical protein [Nostoc sp. WHI]